MNTCAGDEESKTGDFSTSLRKFMQERMTQTKDSLTKILKLGSTASKKNKIIAFAEDMDECY